jgi:hypothetical protein
MMLNGMLDSCLILNLLLPTVELLLLLFCCHSLRRLLLLPIFTNDEKKIFIFTILFCSLLIGREENILFVVGLHQHAATTLKNDSNRMYTITFFDFSTLLLSFSFFLFLFLSLCLSLSLFSSLHFHRIVNDRAFDTQLDYLVHYDNLVETHYLE